MNHLVKYTSLAVLFSFVANACVEHRPIRNGLRDESIYLEKSDLLTQPEVMRITGFIKSPW